MLRCGAKPDCGCLLWDCGDLTNICIENNCTAIIDIDFEMHPIAINMPIAHANNNIVQNSNGNDIGSFIKFLIHGITNEQHDEIMLRFGEIIDNEFTKNWTAFGQYNNKE